MTLGLVRGESNAADDKTMEFEGMVFTSQIMREVQGSILRVAPSTSTVLITGETGVGKELVARAIHKLSLRPKDKFVIVDLSAISETILEGELFGHNRGAFTTAGCDRVGLFESAHGGTIFLDEIGDLSLQAQAKLLRLVDTKSTRRIGSNEFKTYDVRIICATNRDLDNMVKLGQFRKDLFYRLGTLAIFVPPLRERPEDIPLLMQHFLPELSLNNGSAKLISDLLEKLFTKKSWDGNVRELKSELERWGKKIELFGKSDKTAPEVPSRDLTLREMLDLVRKEYITVILQKNRKIGDAAKDLGIDTKSLHRFRRRLGIKRA